MARSHDSSPEQGHSTAPNSDTDPSAGNAPDTPPDIDALPKVRPPRIVDLLGRGGMGSVHLAHDSELDREVALKRPHHPSRVSGAQLSEFVAEARMTGQLQHPNIVPIYGLFADELGAPFFLMQVVEGQTLRSWLSTAPRGASLESAPHGKLQRGVEILMRVCDALAFAHSRQVLHCDIKPENVLVGPHGRVYLVDWGLARRLGGTEALDETLRVAGTPRYMSPEQARGLPLDERSDVFGVGAILYEMAAGSPPYGDDAASAAQRAARGEVTPVAKACRDRVISPRLLEIIERATAPDRAQRYRDVTQLQEALHALLRGGPELSQLEVAEGEVIVRQGEPGDCAYVILRGRCRVTQDRHGSARVLRDLLPGDILGELALILREPRSATVTALEPTTLLVIDRSTLQARGEFDGWSSILLKALAQRFLQLERQLRSD